MNPAAAPGEFVETVAGVIRDLDDIKDAESYYGRIMRSMETELRDHGVGLRWIQCRHDYQKSEFLRSWPDRYAGVAFTGDMYDQKAFVQEAARKLPCPKVIVDHHFDDVPIHSIREDAVCGTRMVAEHLLELGHRHFAYIDNPDLDANPWKRLGVNLALRAAGLKPLNRDAVAGCRSNSSDADSALDWLLQQSQRPTAVICCDDTRAGLLLEAALARGIGVPGSLSIAGYGDSAAPGSTGARLTTVHIDTTAIGRRAAELLLGDPHAAPVAALVPPELLVRDTTGPVARSR